MSARKTEAAGRPSGWGVLVDRNHDQGRTFHLLMADLSPACGASYYTSTLLEPGAKSLCCKKCLRKDDWHDCSECDGRAVRTHEDEALCEGCYQRIIGGKRR